MGVQGLQEYLEKHCPRAVVPVELQKLAQSALVGGPQTLHGPLAPLRLLLDAQSCLQRLYGGSYTDWVCGGQWDRMLSFLSALSEASFSANIHFVVCFNGALERSRLRDWVKRQETERQTSQRILSHVLRKGTPPPKAWFLPPVCLPHCIRQAILTLGLGVVQTVEDHHLEVLTLFRSGGFHGVMGRDSDYALSSICHYFSSHALKLSHDGQRITTTRFLLHEVAKRLNVQLSSFAVFAALLGNHILLEEDLAAFYWTLLGPEHPLASLKVRGHRLLLPPGDVLVPAVAEYVNRITDITDLQTVAQDVFKDTQSCTRDKQVRFQEAVVYYSVISGSSHRGSEEEETKASSKGINVPLVHGSEGSGPSLNGPHTLLFQMVRIPTLDQNFNNAPDFPLSENREHTTVHSNSSLAAGAESEEKVKVEQQTEISVAPPPQSPQSPPQSPQPPPQSPQSHPLLSMEVRTHVDLSSPSLPAVAPEVLRVAEHRHRSGLMYPGVLQILTEGEVKLSVCIEDDTNLELPAAVRLFRPVRQFVYGVLFSLSTATRTEQRAPKDPPQDHRVVVKEWAAYKGKAPQTPELVEALVFRDWTCPSLRQLWLGKTAEDQSRRLRAFLTCMRSDTPAMRRHVPAPFMVLCCVLRCMLQWSGTRILRRHELDAFLAQAVSPERHDPEQDLETEALDARGLQLASVLMSGVDTAMFANDACGRPVPWEHCCPWMFFDGKLFQSKIIRSKQGRGQLLSLCDGQTELTAKVEMMRQSILEGLSCSAP